MTLRPNVAVGVPKAVASVCCGTRHGVPAIPQTAADVDRENCAARTSVILAWLNTLNASQINCRRMPSLMRTLRVTRGSSSASIRLIKDTQRGRPFYVGAMAKWVYRFDELSEVEARVGSWNAVCQLLGTKGATLAKLGCLGLPVPHGFTISTQACDYYFKHGRKYPHELRVQVETNLKWLERVTEKKFGDVRDPLLVSVRSGSARSMPGMTDTILNLGLNDRSVLALARKSGNDRFAWDAYRRFVQMYASVVIGLPKEELEAKLRALKSRLRAKDDTNVTAKGWRELVGEYKAHFRSKTGKSFPEDPQEQLWAAIGAVFESWMAEKAVTYRRVQKITGLLGTAVSVVQMVFGNLGESSGTGVCFTRNPSTGEKKFYGEFLINAQGEDLVAGIRTPMPIQEMRSFFPTAYARLEELARRLEGIYRDAQDFEFVIESGIPWLQMSRTAKRTPMAAVCISIDFLDEGQISRNEALLRVRPEQLAKILGIRILINHGRQPVGFGLGAVPGVADGILVFDRETVEHLANTPKRVIFITQKFVSENLSALHGSNGVITCSGGKTSHEAVICRGWGKPCVVGLEAEVDDQKKLLRIGSETLKQGEMVTLDGASGAVYRGEVPSVTVKIEDHPYLARYAELLWVTDSDEFLEAGLGTLWQLRDTIRDKYFRKPFHPISLLPSPQAEGRLGTQSPTHVAFVQPHPSMICEILDTIHWQRDEDTAAVVWGIMETLRVKLHLEVGVGNHPSAIRPLCSPQESYVVVEARRACSSGEGSECQLVGMEFFGISRLVRNYLTWGNVQWWAVVRLKGTQGRPGWRLDTTNPRGENVIPVECEMEGYLVMVDGKGLSPRETREFYNELRKREIHWDWYEKNSTCWREIVFDFARLSRGEPVALPKLVKYRSAGLLIDDFQLSPAGRAIIISETATNRRNISFGGRPI